MLNIKPPIMPPSRPNHRIAESKEVQCSECKHASYMLHMGMFLCIVNIDDKMDVKGICTCDKFKNRWAAD